MKKGILIVGPQSSGKSLLAKQIAKTEKSVFIDIHKLIDNNFFNPWLFDCCEKDTTMICLDDIPISISLDIFYNWVDNPIEVNKKYQHKFTIHPKILIVLDDIIDISELSDSVKRRFDIIQTDGMYLKYTKNNEIIFKEIQYKK